MTLRSVIADDATGVFLSVDDFAEPVTYHPHQYFGEVPRASREINAVVLRESVQEFTEDGGVVLPIWQIHIANDATDGIASDEIDIGRDQLAFPAKDGEAATRHTITQLLQQDHGMLVVECR